MKKIRRNEFVSWQKFEFEHTFMYQGILLLLSGAASTMLYVLLVIILSLNKESILTTVIHNGDLLTTKLSPLFFWSALAAAATVLALIVFSDLLRFIFKRILVKNESEAEEGKKPSSKQIIRHVRRTITLQYVFYSFVYLLWLYASAVFSFLFKNGMVLYPLIFVMLTFLTFFGKKLFCFPIYVSMKRSENKEKVRRSDEYLLLKTDEGGTHGNIITKPITKERSPVIWSVAESALKTVHAAPVEVKIVMGERVVLSPIAPKKFNVSIGVSALSMLTEEELYAEICCQAMRQKSPCLDSINRFMAFNRSIIFSSSSWNPLERVYTPFNAYILAEMSSMPELMKAADSNFFSLFSERYGEDVEKNAIVAEIKQWVYRNHEFGSDREFNESVFKGKHPVSDYHKRLMRRYATYLSQNADLICDRLSKIGEDPPSVFPYDPQRLALAIRNGNVDLRKRPKGAYNEEVKHFSGDFDTAFALCVRGNYRNVRRAVYLEPNLRIRSFEGERINGAFKSDGEILSVANDYLTLKMPSAALSLISELDNGGTVQARFIEGVARLCLHEKRGIELILSACKEKPALAYSVYSTLLDRFTLILPDEELRSARATVKTCVIKCGAERIRGDRIWSEDDIKGEARLSSRCTPSRLSDKEREELSEDLLRLCQDRLEWVAVINYTENDRSSELVVVRTSKLTSGSYTNSYVDGVYLDSIDLLPSNVRMLNSMAKYSGRNVVIDVYPDAPMEAFERIKGAVIFHKGKIAARRFLSREAKSYESDVEVFDEIDTDESDEE